MILSSVSHVPKFTLNLLFISHITKYLNCNVFLFLSCFLFQNLVTKKMIGRRYEKAGLYLLDTTSPIAAPVSAVSSDASKCLQIRF